MLYDTVRDVTWLSDLNFAKTSGYADANGVAPESAYGSDVVWTDGRMGPGAARDWAESLVFAGQSGWRLPTLDSGDTSCSDSYVPVGYAAQYFGGGCQGGELSHLFVSDLGNNYGESLAETIGDMAEQLANQALFSNAQSYAYWSDAIYQPDNAYAWYFMTAFGSQGTSDTSDAMFAVAVHDGDVAAAAQVPEPQAMALVLLALALMALVYRSTKRSLPARTCLPAGLVLLLSLGPLATQAAPSQQNTDMIVFGDPASEAAHGLTTRFGTAYAGVYGNLPAASDPSATGPSDVVTGALGQTARRLLPRTPNGDYYGGEVTFTMAIDPSNENNFTLKMWGDDPQSQTWLILNIQNSAGTFLELGNRQYKKDESILQNSSGWLPNRFIYRTVRLPKHLTAGRTSVTLRIRSVGYMAYYASRPYDNFQKRMTAPSVGLYQAYSHVGAMPDIAGEVRGSAPQISQVGTTSSAELTWLNAWKSQVTKLLNNRLSATASGLTADDIDFLAQAYRVSWSPAYNNAKVVTQVVGAMDAMTKAYSAAPTTYFTGTFADGGNVNWGGYLGTAGRAIALIWPQLQGQIGATVAYGGTLGTTTRAAAWGAALRASVDYGRMNRRTIGNQAIDAALRTYWGNAALLKVAPDLALYETEARRYLYEAYGLQPWMGDDAAGKGPVPTRGSSPYGPGFYMVTAKGTTKENCLVGGDYGEQGASAFRLGRMINDTALVDQGVKMLRARAALRYPAAAADGSLVSVAANPIGCRNDHQVNQHHVYLSRDTDTVLVASAGAAVIGNDLLGYAQQQFNEGKLLSVMPVTVSNSWYKGGAGWFQIADVPDAYLAFRAQAATGAILPMSSGQPDFAWVDEDNMAVAAKRGEERFFANLFWRGEDAINRLARVFVTTPTSGNLAEVSIDDLKYRYSGKSWVANRYVEATPVSGGFNPPDNPTSANVGLTMLMALRPDLTAVPTVWNRDAGRGTAYAFQYGNWFVAINAHATETYTVPMPKGFESGRDLVSGTVKGSSLVLAPKAAAVFYLPDAKAIAPSGLQSATAMHSGLALGASTAGAADRSTLQQVQVLSAANQRWTLEPTASGDYRVRVQASGLVLEAASKTLASGSALMVRPDRADDLQLWRVVPDLTEGAAVRVCAKRNPNMCLSVGRGTTQVDAPVVLLPWQSLAAQKWRLATP